MEKPHALEIQTSPHHVVTQITADKLLSFSLKTDFLAQDKLKEITLKSIYKPKTLILATKPPKAPSSNCLAESLGLTSSGIVKFHRITLEKHIFSMTFAKDLSNKTGGFSGF